MRMAFCRAGDRRRVFDGTGGACPCRNGVRATGESHRGLSARLPGRSDCPGTDAKARRKGRPLHRRESCRARAGIIGNTAAAKAAPDGCTLLVVNQNFVVQPAVNAKFSYDVPGSFAPVAFLATAPETISVNPSVPAKTMQELIALLKANPGKYSYASPGYASSPHIAAERLFRLTHGLDVTHVPFQGGPPAVTSTIGGHTAIVHLTLPVVAPSVKDGKLRMLAVADQKRHPEFPDVPTLAEAGIPNHEVGFWNALLAPRGTPADILDDLNRQVAQVMAQPEVREKLGVIGFTRRDRLACGVGRAHRRRACAMEVHRHSGQDQDRLSSLQWSARHSIRTC